MRPTIRRPVFRLPILVFSTVYLAFLLVLWLPISDWFPGALQAVSVSPALVGFHPSASVVGLYLGGLVAVLAGYVPATQMLGHRVGVHWSPSPRAVRWGWALGCSLSLAALAAQFVVLRAVPLFSLSTRWSLNPKLVLLASFLAALVPMGFLLFGRRWSTFAVAAAALCGFVGLGYRGGALVLVLSSVLAISMTLRSGPRWRFLLGGFALAVLVFAAVGVVSKSQIYGHKAGGMQTAVALSQSDSIGTFYNLERLKTKVDRQGTRHGALLGDTIVNILPGQRRDYANYQIGAMLGARASVIVDGKPIDRSVSLSTTLVGPPFADGGFIAVGVFGLVLGVLWGWLESVAVANRWFLGWFTMWAAACVAGIYAGLYLESFLVVTAVVACLAALAVIRSRRSADRRVGGSRRAPTAVHA